ncbi:hypothetical protein H4219_000469 [Mycoemilia scoparia]|uniref:Uncharacterized protein n=1 Tax=Mycoemilia scoparia TaxID=417184 RepID=A0A9W8ABW9_9FUNG|nr:hypothetical protein H4219_000469 [Mycoemilia scoparia]
MSRGNTPVASARWPQARTRASPSDQHKNHRMRPLSTATQADFEARGIGARVGYVSAADNARVNNDAPLSYSLTTGSVRNHSMFLNTLELPIDTNQLRRSDVSHVHLPVSDRNQNESALPEQGRTAKKITSDNRNPSMPALQQDKRSSLACERIKSSFSNNVNSQQTQGPVVSNLEKLLKASGPSTKDPSPKQTGSTQASPKDHDAVRSIATEHPLSDSKASCVSSGDRDTDTENGITSDKTAVITPTSYMASTATIPIRGVKSPSTETLGSLNSHHFSYQSYTSPSASSSRSYPHQASTSRPHSPTEETSLLLEAQGSSTYEGILIPRHTIQIEDHSVTSSPTFVNRYQQRPTEHESSKFPDAVRTLFGGRSQVDIRRTYKATKDLLTWPLQYIPAVILGLILNLLDGLSYGLIAFPTSVALFSKLGPDGLSMYLLSTVISQFVYSMGASAFRGANGCMMVEVIPFLHEMAFIVMGAVGEDNPHSVIATTMVAYALSALLTGIVFALMGALKLGMLVDFFPRHILVGCIGGVGYFLFQTGLEVSSRIPISFTLDTLVKLFEPDTFALWGSSLMVAIVLRSLNAQIPHPLFVPIFFISVLVLFYFVTWCLGISLNTLRATGWVFELPDTNVPFYHFYTLFDLSATNWNAILKTVPTMFGLAFFGILHVPINVPALAVSTHMDKIDTNRELIAHGLSNFISGLFGSFQNYLVYSNSVLFIKSGGGSNLAGLMLGFATLAIFFAGPTVIGFIPTMVVGGLIFHLGLELMKEALVDTWDTVSSIEYTTIVIIVLTMALLGFNQGIFLGILLACIFFIIIYSRRRPIRKSFTGTVARSTVRRVYRQRRFLEEAGHLIHVIRLQGFMFFGTINSVETSIRKQLDQRQWENDPIQFLVLDFALVTGLDFSAAEAFIRIKRLLTSKEIHMVICGASLNSSVGQAMQSVGVWSKDDDRYVQTFSTLNESLEWCENILLKSYYTHRAAISPESTSIPQPYANISHPHYEMRVSDHLKIPRNYTAGNIDITEFSGSPRQNMLHKATRTVMMHESTSSMGLSKKEGDSRNAANNTQYSTPSIQNNLSPPLPLLIQAFQDVMTDEFADDLFYIAPYFVKKTMPTNTYLWHKFDTSTGLYIVESGLLRVLNEASNSPDQVVVESILPGTIIGELTLFTNRQQACSVVTEGQVVLWELTKAAYEELCAKNPKRGLGFTRLALYYTAQSIGSITAHAFHM